MTGSTVQQQVRSFYDAVGWKQIGPGVYQNARYEDLRPVSRDYIHRCHLRFGGYLPALGRLFLDAGSGPIQYPEYLTYSPGYHRRVCLDISRLALAEARQRIGDHGLYVIGDVARLPFRSDAFDGAASLHTLHHLPAAEQGRALAELVRCLTPGGRVGIVYSWGEHAGIVRWTRPLVSLAESARTIARTLRRKAPSAEPMEKGEVAALLHTAGSYTFKHDFAWAKATLKPLGESRIVVWRSTSTAMLRALAHPFLFGRAGLRLLFALENLAPETFGRHGAYSTLLITKAAAAPLAQLAGEQVAGVQGVSGAQLEVSSHCGSGFRPSMEPGTEGRGSLVVKEGAGA
jgi:SAM-dependent methyltransferase